MLHRAFHWISLSLLLTATATALPAQGSRKAGAETALASLLARYDTNRDGAVQKAEYPRGDRGFAHLDRDGDGDVDAADFASRPARGALQKLRQSLQAPKLPQVGDMAPDFELPMVGMKDTKVRLSKLRGERPVALVFGSIT